MWDYNTYYKSWIKNRLIEIKADLGFSAYDIEVFNEQVFAGVNALKPKTITIILKYLSSDIVLHARTQPIQLIAVAEGNSLAVCNTILSRFCELFNFVTTTHNDSGNNVTMVKHMYSTPVTLSNFEIVGTTLRNVFYINTTLIILDDVMDIENLEIDDVAIEAASCTIAYTMTGDTQPFGGVFAETRKNFSTFALTVTVPCVSNNFTNKCVTIMSGASTDAGDDEFSVEFNVANIDFSFTMRLIGATLTTAKNTPPSLQLSFMV